MRVRPITEHIVTARAVVASLPNVSPFKERIINCVKRRRTGFYTALPEASHSPFPLFCLLSPLLTVPRTTPLRAAKK